MKTMKNIGALYVSVWRTAEVLLKLCSYPDLKERKETIRKTKV